MTNDPATTQLMWFNISANAIKQNVFILKKDVYSFPLLVQLNIEKQKHPLISIATQDTMRKNYMKMGFSFFKLVPLQKQLSQRKEKWKTCINKGLWSPPPPPKLMSVRLKRAVCTGPSTKFKQDSLLKTHSADKCENTDRNLNVSQCSGLWQLHSSRLFNY